MDDRSLVRMLIEIGVAARQSKKKYAQPTDYSDLRTISAANDCQLARGAWATSANWRCAAMLTTSGAGFQFQVTDDAVRLWSDQSQFEQWLDTVVPAPLDFDVFISYATGDAGIADELRRDLQQNGLTSFMAEKDIKIATEWQDSICRALRGSKRILILLTPRSINRPWVLMKTGAAWALGKPLIPALAHVGADELLEPIRRYQARVIETTAQRQRLVAELTSTGPVSPSS